MTTNTTISVVLVPGFWLGGWAWDRVVGPLRDDGLTPHPVTLPGLGVDDSAGEITRADHVGTVSSLLDSLDGDIVLVGHSGGGTLIQEVADQDPTRIRRLVFVDSGPLRDGATLAAPTEDAVIELPSWDELTAQGSSLDGISAEDLDLFRQRARPQPALVATAPVRVNNPARLRIPVTTICTSISSADLKELIKPGGPLPAELDDYAVSWVDLPTGHWPMFSRPDDLAAIIAAAARQ